MSESQVVELEKAVGQYGIYEELLKRFGIKRMIYSLSKKEPLLWKTP